MGDFSALQVLGCAILGVLALYVVVRVGTAAYFKSKRQFEGTPK